MSMKFPLMVAVQWLLVASALAQPTAPQQAALNAAVRDYEAGRLAPARAALSRLARLGLPAAQYNLAVMHLRGEVPRPDARQAQPCCAWRPRAASSPRSSCWRKAWKRAASARVIWSQAHDWYQRAAQAGSVPAQVAMGTAYFLGRGRGQDSTRAAQWYREAAQGGDEGAMYLIASMYEQGDGLPRDLRLARHWYGQAAALGDVAAKAKWQALQVLEDAAN
jgi:TPR repeat protein